MKDIQIIPDTTGVVNFEIIGASNDTGLMLLQRLYILLFCNQTDVYRNDGIGVSILSFIEGGNTPSSSVLNAMLSLACSSAVSMLDDSDKNNISSFIGFAEQDYVIFELSLIDGTTIKGSLKNG